MTQAQTNRLNALLRVKKLNADNNTVLSAIQGYPDEETDLNGFIDKIIAAQTNQATDTTGLAQNKTSLKKANAVTISKFGLLGVVSARRAANKELVKELYHPKSYYMDTDDNLTIARSTSTKDLINKNLATLTNITAADVTTMEKSIKAFSDVKDQPTSATETKKAQGTNPIPDLLNEADITIENMSILIHANIPDTALANEFDLQSQIINSGVRHNHVTFHILDAATGQEIVGAVAVCVKDGKTFTPDTTTIDGVPTGKQHFTVSAAGYTTQDVIAKVIRSTDTQVTVSLKKA